MSRIRPVLSPVLWSLTALLFLAAANASLAADTKRPPTAGMIENLIEESLGKDKVEPFSLTVLKGAEVQEIELIDRKGGSTVGWAVEIELQADYGPAPAGIVGFERVRRGRYFLELVPRDGQLHLKRFYQIGEVKLLPAGR